jgi:hypothetical protein
MEPPRPFLQCKFQIGISVKGSGQDYPLQTDNSNFGIKSGAASVCGSHFSRSTREMGHPTFCGACLVTSGAEARYLVVFDVGLKACSTLVALRGAEALVFHGGAAFGTTERRALPRMRLSQRKHQRQRLALQVPEFPTPSAGSGQALAHRMRKDGAASAFLGMGGQNQDQSQRPRAGVSVPHALL